MGSAGPWKDWIGYGPSTHPVSGLQFLWNYPEDAERPAGSTNIYPDHFVAHPGHHFEDPQLAARGYHKRVEQRGFGEIVVEGTPFLGSDLPEPITTPAPLLGEHTREICRERLGLSDAEIEAFFAAGVLEDPP
jgi:hypothetical protein